MSLLLMWKQQLLMNNFKYFSLTGSGRLLLPGSIKGKFKELTLSGTSVQGENPSPDNPQEIKSAGRKSKNLLNLQKQPDVKETYLGWKVSDGRNVVLSVKDKGNNADITGCYLGLSRTGGSSDGVVWVVNNGSVAVKEVVSKNQYVSVFPSNETTVRKLLERFDIQVEYGNNATDYEPYGYLIDLKITGENLLSNKPTDWMIGKTTSWGAVPQTPVSYGTNVKNAIATINVKSSTNYTYINKETNKLWVYRIIERDENGLGYVNHAFYKDESLKYKKYNFSTRSNTANIVFEIKRVDNTELLSTDIESIKIMLVEGDIDESTPYEPYIEQSMQITLDEPLRGIGEYKDVLTKDGVVRRIKEVVITADTPITCMLGQYGAPETNTVLCRYKDISLKKGGAILCKELKKINNWAKDEESVSMTEQGIDFRLSRERLRLGSDTTPEENKVAVIKYLENHPLHCIAELNVPTTEPLPESVQQQLQALHSENGTTHVIIDSGEVAAEISATYMRK